MMHAPRQRTAEEERARAAAKQAERELWERTRGAGSAVFKLADAGTIKRRRQHRVSPQPLSKRHQLLWQPSNSRRSLEAGPGVASIDNDTNRLDNLSLSKQASASHSRTPSGKSNDAREAEDPCDLAPWSAHDILPSLEEVEAKRYEPVEVPSADVLLSRGICEYTLLPKVLGRGKFSTVFIAMKNEERWAIKHTALFPHHQLIATRLLREPTLLAELPPHPNLVAVKETIRTPGHFYLVEEFLEDYVTLEALIPMYSDNHPPTLPTDVANRIMIQLLSAVHAIHHPLQICHRDIKPENILVHPKTLQLKLLDFGLATHFSRSEAKLSTCCGSPAFHCPEIVKALANAPGTVTYMGPEVDAWTCGVTMLRCLVGARFPLGASHSSLRSMTIRAQRAVAMIADSTLRTKVGALLEMDGTKRMQNFEALVAEQERELGEPSRGPKAFRSTTFIPADPVHSIRLPILESVHKGDDDTPQQTPGFTTPTSVSRRTTPANSRPSSPTRSPTLNPDMLLPGSHGDVFAALNPTNQPPERVISFVKYCLRCAGILYHTWSDMPSSAGMSKGDDGSSSHATAPTRGVSSAFVEAAGLPLDTASGPWTPLFPPTFTASEERADGYAHVQIFQCVLEIPDDDGSEQEKGQGQMTFVQSIMAAFGRKLAPSPTSSQQKPLDQVTSQTRSGSPSGRAGEGKRSMSTPARVRTETGNAKSVGQRKEGNVRCLTFHLIVRFPKATHGQTARQPMSRNSSFFSPGLFEGSPRSSRSRGSSSTALSSVGDLDHHGQANLEQAKAIDNGDQHTSSTLRTHAPGHRARTTPKEREGRLRTVRVLEDVGLTPIDTTARIDGGDGYTALTSPHPDRSPSASRPHSRTRKRSHLGSSSRRSKVLFEVTDERAMQAVRNALSVGGSVEAKAHLPHQANGSQRDRPTTPTPTRNARSVSAARNENSETGPSRLSTDLTERGSSPKEICLAIQERLEIIGAGDRLHSPSSEEALSNADDKLETVPEREELEVNTTANQSQAVEVSSLLHHLGMVVPRIKTQRPHKFIEPLVTLIPRAIRAAIMYDAHKSEHAVPEKSLLASEVYEEVPGTSRTRKDTSPPPTQDMIAARVCDIAVSLEELMRHTKQWTSSTDNEEELVQGLLISMFMGSLIALVPLLPKPQNSGTLAQWYFQSWKPRFTFSRPHDDREILVTPPAHFEKRSERAWDRLRRLVRLLDLDLENLAFERSDVSKAASGSTGAAIVSMGAFMLFIGLQAREREQSCEAQKAGGYWSKEDALRRLLLALPLVTASMGTEMPVTTSNSGSNTLGGAAHLPDAALTWVMWCIKDLGDACLSDEDAIILVHTIARHAALSPNPPSRFVALDLVRSLIEKHTTPATARHLLQDLIVKSPTTHLRVAILGVARELIALDLAKEDEANNDSERSGNMIFASPELLNTLNSCVLRLRDDLPAEKLIAADDLRTFLEDSGQWINECLGYVYLVVARDIHNLTGIRRPETLQSIVQDLVNPVEAWITENMARFESVDQSTTPAGDGDAQATPTVTETDDVVLSLSMLSVAVERAKLALDAHGGNLAENKEGNENENSHASRESNTSIASA